MFLLNTVLFSALLICTIRTSAWEDFGTQSKVHYGVPPEKDYPSLVSLGFVDSETGNLGVICGATLISEQHILTAAHCFYVAADYNITKFRVVLGSRDSVGSPMPPGAQEFRFGVKAWTLNPGYKGASDGYKYDSAIITLPKKVKITGTVKTIPLATGVYTTNVRVVGWGKENCGGNRPRKYLYANGTIVSNEECAKAYHDPSMHDSKICALFTSNGEESGSDQGDSGGPLYAEHGGQDVQIGLVSYSAKHNVNGKECTLTSVPMVYANVAAAREFIVKHTQGVVWV